MSPSVDNDHESRRSGSQRSDSVVHLEDVVAVLGSFPALAGASLSVERGEIVLLRGPNGAGKTSLLKVCAGLLPIERGTGSILGCDLVSERDVVKSRVGYLAHHNGLYADLTVTENIRYWGRLTGASETDIDRAIIGLGLDGRLAELKVASLSAGQKRRVALACLVARRAELWLLDEPHAGLDARSRDELDGVLRAAAAAGATVMVASHELDRAGALATRQVEVVAGRVQEMKP
ncbi:MAG: heme ABC exporter ATP-binding protein CcmA [Actinomycetota bacterium]